MPLAPAGFCMGHQVIGERSLGVRSQALQRAAPQLRMALGRDMCTAVGISWLLLMHSCCMQRQTISFAAIDGSVPPSRLISDDEARGSIITLAILAKGPYWP
jgi:hypothetical protein